MVPNRSLSTILQHLTVGGLLSSMIGCSVPNLLVSHPITVISAFDQSESARNDSVYNQALQKVCRLQSNLAEDSDMMLTLYFADETEVSDRSTISTGLDALNICDHQAEQRRQLRIGQTPGTSIHKAVERIVLQTHQLKQQPDPTAAKVLILMIHANETQNAPEAFATTAAHLKQLLQQQTAITILVADAELERALERSFLDLPIQICPISEPTFCIQQSYKAARQMATQRSI